MSLSSLTIYCLRVPFVESFAHATKDRRASDAIVVAVESEDGSVGYGEGLPRPYVTGETVDSVVRFITDTVWPRIRGQALPAVSADMVARTGELLGSTQGKDGVVAHNAARCSLELAIIDCALRRDGVSLRDVLPESGPTPPCSGVITTGSVERAVQLARMMKRIGLPHVKVKVGDADSVGRVAALRKELGAGVSIRVDANGAWTLDEAAGELERMAQFDVASCEEPLGRERASDLPALCKRSPIPIMLDESLVTMGDARRAADDGACHLFNVRLSKCGGIGPVTEMAALAAARGLGAQLGCHVGETAVLAAAGQHVAASLPNLRFVEGAFGTLLLAEDIASPSIRFGHRGKVPPLRGPGLGMNVVSDRVTKYAEKQLVLS